MSSARKRTDQWLHHQAIQIAAQLPADPDEADAILDRARLVIRCMQLMEEQSGGKHEGRPALTLVGH